MLPRYKYERNPPKSVTRFTGEQSISRTYFITPKVSTQNSGKSTIGPVQPNYGFETDTNCMLLRLYAAHSFSHVTRIMPLSLSSVLAFVQDL